MNSSLQSFNRTINVAWPQMQETQAKRHLIKVATDGHAKILQEQTARTGQRPDFELYVNRPGNTNLESVVLPGPIVYRYRYIREVMIAAIGELRKASPVVSGAYRDNHTLYINGVEMQDVPRDLKPGDRVMIANPLAYARRIEVGKTKSGRAFVIQVRPRIYERVVKFVLTPRYKNVAKITFGYVTLDGAAKITGAMQKRTPNIGTGSRRRSRRRHAGETVQSPAIFIEQM